MINNAAFWNLTAEEYNEKVFITTDDFHYGPLVPGDNELKLLPSSLKGKRCLELGCGAAHNSVFLTQQGAACTALDPSAEQLRFAEKLIREKQQDIQLLNIACENLRSVELPTFDLIHSSYALSFVDDLPRVLKDISNLLDDNGYFIFSTGHPLSAGEWVEIDDNEMGLFLPEYFQPAPDIRYDSENNPVVCSRFYSISTLFQWIVDAGMSVELIAEPKAIAYKHGQDDPAKLFPYFSYEWLEIYEQFRHVPLLLIMKCRKK